MSVVVKILPIPVFFISDGLCYAGFQNPCIITPESAMHTFVALHDLVVRIPLLYPALNIGENTMLSDASRRNYLDLCQIARCPFW